MTTGTEQNGHEAHKGTTDWSADIRAAREALEAKREEEANQRTLAREAREAEQHKSREAREAQEHEARMLSNASSRDAEKRLAALLDVAVKVGTAYAPVADAHAEATIAKFKTATFYEGAKQELMQRILKAQTPEELKALQQKLEATHKVATI